MELCSIEGHSEDYEMWAGAHHRQGAQGRPLPEAEISADLSAPGSWLGEARAKSISGLRAAGAEPGGGSRLCRFVCGAQKDRCAPGTEEGWMS